MVAGCDPAQAESPAMIIEMYGLDGLAKCELVKDNEFVESYGKDLTTLDTTRCAS